MDDRMKNLRRMALDDPEAADALFRMEVLAGDRMSRWEAAIEWTSGRYFSMDLPRRANLFKPTITQCWDCSANYYGRDGQWTDHAPGCAQSGRWRTWELMPVLDADGRATGASEYLPIAYRYDPPRRCHDVLIDTLAHHFGVPNFRSNGHRWGDASGETMLDGVRFVLLPQADDFYSPDAPKGKRYKGQHRLKIECPHCGILVGTSKFRQHAKRKDHSDAR